MTTQPSLFDPVVAEARKQDAMAAVDAAHSPAFRADWLDVIHAICRQQTFFTTDDVIRLGIQRGLDEPREARVFGPWMKSASTNGWCRMTRASTKSERVKLHHGNCRIWASLLADQHPVDCPNCRGIGLIIPTT